MKYYLKVVSYESQIVFGNSTTDVNGLTLLHKNNRFDNIFGSEIHHERVELLQKKAFIYFTEIQCSYVVRSKVSTINLVRTVTFPVPTAVN